MKIAVTSSSFSRNELLRNELLKLFPDSILFNGDGKKLENDSLIDFIKDADAVIVGLEKIDSIVLGCCKNLKIVSKFGVGLDNIDIDCCRRRNIAIGWTAGVNKLSVAEMVLAFMIMLNRNIFTTSFALKNGCWNKSGGFNLTNKTVGIIGVGNIGKEVIRLLNPFLCNILVNDTVDQTEYYNNTGVLEVEKNEIYKNADFISLHTPLTDKTRNLINADVFKMMKKTSFVINTARGGIVSLMDLKDALRKNIIAGAAVDVYDVEPPVDEEFLQLKNLICTPHIGGNSYESVVAMGMSAINHIKKYYSRVPSSCRVMGF